MRDENEPTMLPYSAANRDLQAGMMSEEEWEEVAQEIPAADDPIIQKYLTGREALMDEEKKRRSDYSFVLYPEETLRQILAG